MEGNLNFVNKGQPNLKKMEDVLRFSNGIEPQFILHITADLSCFVNDNLNNYVFAKYKWL
jgi:hypothetical protein